MVLTDLKKELMTDKASFRAIIEQWPTVKCYNIKRFLQFSASTKPHDKTLICYYFLSSGCAKGKTKKLKIVLSKYKTKLKIDLSKYILYFHHRQISVDCWQSHLIQRGKTFSLKLNSTKCGWESIDDAAGGLLINHDTFIQCSCKKDCNYTFSVQCTFVHVLASFGDNWSQIMITDGLQKAINIFFMILVQFLAEMFLVSDTNLRWQIPETFSIFGRSLSGIYWRGMGGTVFVQPVRYLSKQILWKSSYQ